MNQKNVRMLGGKIAKMQDMGYRVLNKEMNIESLLKKEEQQREELELKNLLAKIRAEKRKKECMDKKIRERELEDKKLLAERDNKAEISKIKKDISLDIELKRRELKRQIEFMRRRSKRKAAALESELQGIKSKMGKNLMRASKMGLISNCRKGKKTPMARETYCNANFVEDYIKNSDCKTDEEFCYMCCENEFGNMFLRKREQCYDMCDKNEKKQKKKRKKNDKW